MKAPLSIDRHAALRREIAAVACLVAVDPLDRIRELWRKLSPEQRAEFAEESHLQPSTPPEHDR